MSRIRADKLVSRAGNSAPELTYGVSIPVGYGITGAGGINITGIITATTFVGALTGTASNVTTNANLTGHVTSVGNAAVLGSFTSLQLLTALTDETGSGANVFATSPTLTTPILGTPQSGTLTSCTGLPISTGVAGLAANVATFLATPSSSNLAAALTDETGSGANVFATSPTLTTPILGTPQSGTLTSCTGLPLTTGVTGTLPVANGGTGVTGSTGSGSVVLSTSPTLTTPILGTPQSGTLTSCTGLPVSTGISGLAANVATFLATPSSANLAAALTDETGSGSAVFATSPTLVTPILGSASATNLNVSGVTTSATFNTGVIGSQTSGILTTTATTADQVLDSLPTATFQTARYQVSIACTGQLVTAGMSTNITSVGVITAGSGYIDATYTNVAITGGSGNDARANIGIGLSFNQVGFTSATDLIVTTATHGLGIGGSIAVLFASSIPNSGFTGFAVTSGNVYYAVGVGTTTFTLFNNASGTSQVTGIGTTTFTGVGNTMTKAGGVTSVVIVSPGSGYVTGNTLSATLGTIGSGFSFPASTVVRNYQSTDVMIMQSVGSAATACDYIEYASLANSEILASFRADISGANARLLVTPTYRNNTLKVIRSGITV